MLQYRYTLLVYHLDIKTNNRHCVHPDIRDLAIVVYCQIHHLP